eukprot:s334_g41.t1
MGMHRKSLVAGSSQEKNLKRNLGHAAWALRIWALLGLRDWPLLAKLAGNLAEVRCPDSLPNQKLGRVGTRLRPSSGLAGEFACFHRRPGQGYSGPPVTPTVAPAGPGSLSWLRREEIAEEIGRWSARALEGQHRGLSGREKKPLGCKVWVVVRDFAGQIYTPVRAFRTWGSCKNLCKQRQYCGDSIFIGFPPEREAQRLSGPSRRQGCSGRRSLSNVRSRDDPPGAGRARICLPLCGQQAEEEAPADDGMGDDEGFEHGARVPESEAITTDGLAKRMSHLEAALDSVQSGLQLLLQRRGVDGGDGGRGSADGAGIPSAQLQQMERVVLQNAKARKTADVNRDLKIDPLSEEDAPASMGSTRAWSGRSSQPACTDAVSATLQKLTSIMEILTEDRRKKVGSSKLDAALDGAANASSSELLPPGSGKKTAVARRVLRATFQDHPGEIFMLIEKLMFEDLNSRTMIAGQAPIGISAPGWVEFRSKIGNYKTAGHAAWALAGVVDAMIADNPALARARACLGLLQIDQSSVDKGSWLLASALSLEQGPPLIAMSQHVPPDTQNGEPPFSRLLDSRWAEIALGHLKDQDDYLSRRRSIGKATNTKPATDGDASDLKKQGKAKAKAKAASGEKEEDA